MTFTSDKRFSYAGQKNKLKNNLKKKSMAVFKAKLVSVVWPLPVFYQFKHLTTSVALEVIAL